LSGGGDGSLRKKLSSDSGGKSFGRVDNVDDVDFALALYIMTVDQCRFHLSRRLALILTSIDSLCSNTNEEQD
jgi:hypothetical protein